MIKRLRFIIPVIFLILFFSFALACNGTVVEKVEEVAEVEESEEDIEIGLPESEREKAFYDLVELQDSIPFDDPEWTEKQDEAYVIIARKYGITENEMQKIAIEGVEKNWPMPGIEIEPAEDFVEDESVEKLEEEIIETLNYKIVYVDHNARYDNGVGYYVLVDPVDITNDRYKIAIKNIIRELVGKKGNTISISFFDHIKALENEYDYYVKGKTSLVSDSEYLEYEKYHYISGYDGNLGTGLYLNTLYFFYPDDTSDIIKFNPYSEAESYAK